MLSDDFVDYCPLQLKITPKRERNRKRKRKRKKGEKRAYSPGQISKPWDNILLTQHCQDNIDKSWTWIKAPGCWFLDKNDDVTAPILLNRGDACRSIRENKTTGCYEPDTGSSCWRLSKCTSRNVYNIFRDRWLSCPGELFSVPLPR